MGRKKNNKSTIIILLVLVLLAAALLAAMIWFMMNHFFVGGKAYPNQADTLDLRDRSISVEEYEAIREELPESRILWSIPFQNSAYPDDTTRLTVRQLSDQDLSVLTYFTELEAVDATGCTEYDILQKLQERYPDLEVTYTVTIGGKEYPKDAEKVVCNDLTDEEIALMAHLPELRHVDATGCQNHERIAVLMQSHPELEVSYQVQVLGQTFTEADTSVTFKNPDVDALMEGLASLPAMKSVHLVEPAAEAEKLLQMMQMYPQITFTWDKTVLGKTFNSAETEYDFTDISLSETRITGWRIPNRFLSKSGVRGSV